MYSPSLTKGVEASKGPLPAPGAWASMAVSLLLLLVSRSAAGQHVALPPVNLGATSFLDAVGGPGLLVQETLEPYHANHINSSSGRAVPGDNAISSFAWSTILDYTTHRGILGGLFGIEVIVPSAHVAIKTMDGPWKEQTGVGDLVVSPLVLQWPEQKVLGKAFSQRLDLDVHLPTGAYRRFDDVNIGSNLVSINPYYSFTLFLTPQLETSWRFHYLWNSSNNEPSPRFQASSIQPGQALHFNAAVSYEVRPGLRLGIAGYYLRELSDPWIDARTVAESKEQVASIGPGFAISIKTITVIVNAYHEFEARNRSRGNAVVCQMVKVFELGDHQPPIMK